MKVVIKGPVRDTLEFILHLRKRRRLFRRAVPWEAAPGDINKLARALHPQRQVLRIQEVRSETPTSRTFILVPAEEPEKVAFFRAGQYIAVQDVVQGTPVSRPFSIVSSPDESLEKNSYAITVKLKDDGFFSPWAIERWKSGKVLTCTAPAGTFYYEPLRDSRNILCIAGGSGITPCMSIVKDGLDHSDVSFRLIYGVTDPAEIMYRDELEQLERTYPGRFACIPVTSNDAPGWTGERGFITAGVIRKHAPEIGKASVFICGPPAMHALLRSELRDFQLPRKRIREEVYCPELPEKAHSTERFTITVLSVKERQRIPALGNETVLTALERAGLDPPALCRAGECGWCRSRLVEGNIYAPGDTGGVRRADVKFGWFHPCSSYPRSDLVIEVPENPLQG